MAKPDFSSVADTVRSGGVVVMPTDTIYGLVASALNPIAVERIYDLKGRENTKPCVVLIADRSDLKQLWATVPADLEPELAKLWPGPNSIVFDVDPIHQPHLHRGRNTVAVRMPDYPQLQALIRLVGPIVATSANRSGDPVATRIEAARSIFGDHVDQYLDGGELAGAASRVVAWQNGQVVTLRS